LAAKCKWHLEDKAKAMLPRSQSQGYATSRPRPPKFVLEVSLRTRTVLEDNIPEQEAIS